MIEIKDLNSVIMDSISIMHAKKMGRHNIAGTGTSPLIEEGMRSPKINRKGECDIFYKNWGLAKGLGAVKKGDA